MQRAFGGCCGVGRKKGKVLLFPFGGTLFIALSIVDIYGVSKVNR
jgi:hypothetical protein